jgi:hypothetical protein
MSEDLDSLVAPRPDWTEKDICLLLPQYKQTNPLTLFSLLAMFDRTRMGAILEYGDAFIIHTRNKLASRFLTLGFEWALFVDDDMILPCGNAEWFASVTRMRLSPERAGLHTINRLRSHKKTLVGGLYFHRSEKGRALFAEARDNPELIASIRAGKIGGIRPTGWVATGCMLIHRQVLLDIQRQFPHLAPRGDSKLWQFFSPASDVLFPAIEKAEKALADGLLEDAQAILADANKLAKSISIGSGEDVLFCRRARQAGHMPHVDLDLQPGHVGSCVYGASNTTG